MEDIVYLPLNISNGINIAHYKDLKNFLAKMYNNSKYETIIRI